MNSNSVLSPVVVQAIDQYFFNSDDIDNMKVWIHYMDEESEWKWLVNVKEMYFRPFVDDKQWLTKYHEKTFFELFRLRTDTFKKLVRIIMENDQHNLLKKKYRGGNYPVQPEKSILVFLWYMATQDSLIYIGDRFHLCAAKVMQIVNAVLYVTISLKNRYIFWPTLQNEYNTIRNEFQRYPGTLGALDGTHINIKISQDQHDSYVDRYLSHSINVMAICTAKKLLTYIFAGFPGAAHDARVFSNSMFVRNIEQYGPEFYFPSPEYHLIADSAFSIRPWLMTPYRQNNNLGPMERRHNYCLGADRVAIENCFGIIKGRWRRLQFINVYSVFKCVEIATAACILHNFTYRNNDEWNGELFHEQRNRQPFEDNDRQQMRLGQEKRNRIARQLFH